MIRLCENKELSVQKRSQSRWEVFLRPLKYIPTFYLTSISLFDPEKNVQHLYLWFSLDHFNMHFYRQI